MNKFLPFILLILISKTGFTQQNVSVLVRDVVNKKASIGVNVVLKNIDFGYEQQVVTNDYGIAYFNSKTVGSFLVYVGESDLLIAYDTAVVNVRSNESASAQIFSANKMIELPAIVLESEKYSVTKLNASNAEVSSELNIEEIKQLPIEGRDITRSLYRLPNVSQATGFYPEAPNVAINGANSLFTNYLIDGMDNNENFLGGMRFNIPVGFTENIQVLTNNFSAEYGNTANGIINITSKSGSNKTSGELFYLSRPGPVIDASSPYAQRDLSGNQVKDGFQRQQLGFSVGGAIIPNKTFYYINYEQTYDIKDNLLNVPELGINETVRGTNSFGYLSAKVDEFWSQKFHSSIRFNLGQVSIDRQGGGLEGGVAFPSAANTQLRNSFTVASQNEYYGDKFTAQTNYQYASFNWNYANAVNPNSPNVTVLGPNNQTIALLGHPGYLFNEYE
ncbi:MAG: TonB-dependent receptor plug domain-containing protein, partial [Bacteroidia bacterium]